MLGKEFKKENAAALLIRYYQSFHELNSIKLRETSQSISLRQNNQTFEFAVEEKKERIDIETYWALQTTDETKTERKFWKMAENSEQQ